MPGSVPALCPSPGAAIPLRIGGRDRQFARSRPGMQVALPLPESVGGLNMHARETVGRSNERPATRQGAAAPVFANREWAFTSKYTRVARAIAALFSLATVVGCGADTDEADTAESQQALATTTSASDVFAASANKAQGTTGRATNVTGVRSPGGAVFGQGTVVVAFSRDPDGAWHCVGDADCNKMFSAGVCTGGILDSSCDTTGQVECWCY